MGPIWWDWYVLLPSNQAPRLVSFSVTHRTLRTAICPDSDFNPYWLLDKYLIPYSLNLNLSTSQPPLLPFAFCSLNLLIPLQGYLSTLVPSPIPLLGPQFLICSLHSNSQGNVLLLPPLLPKHGICQSVHDVASRVVWMKSNVEKGQPQEESQNHAP